MAIYAGVITGGFGGFVADSPALGWRLAFTACGIVGIVYALPLVFAIRDASRQAPSQAGSKPSPMHAVRGLLTNFHFVLLVLYFTLPALAGWVVRDWMPAILKQQFHIGQGKAGVAATVYWQGAAVAGAIAGDGWRTDGCGGNGGAGFLSALSGWVSSCRPSSA